MSVEAERAVIGCLLMEVSRADDIPFLQPDMFKSPYTGKLYREIIRLYKSGIEPEVTLIRENLINEQFPPEIFKQEIANCLNATSYSGHAIDYAKIIFGDYKAEKLKKIISQTNFDRQTVDDAVQDLKKSIDSLSQYTAERTETVAEAVEKYAPEKFTPKGEKPIKTGIGAIDDIILGIEKGNMIIVAARPAVGKSALATEIALNIAKGGKRCEVFNLEMRNQDTYDRLISHESGIEIQHIKYAESASINEMDLFDRGNKALSELGDKLLMVDDLFYVSDIVTRAKRDKAEVVVIDYAQLLQIKSQYRDRTSQVGEISRSIKLAALRLNIPFIVLAQLNRASTLTADNKPSMSELRESGAWEQDADKIILLWNKDINNRQIKGVLIDKNRQGKTGEAELKFDGAIMSFSSYENFQDDVNEDTPFV